MNRLNPLYLFRGQWKSLTDHRGTRPRPAVLLRLLLIAVPLGAGAWFFFGNGTLRDPGAILAALSLLAGALLAAFSQLSNWRQTLAQREEQYEVSDQIDRDHLDETAAQLLVASYSSAVGSLLLVVAMNFSVNNDGHATGVWTALAVAVSVYVLIVFLMAVPRLYSAYVNLNNVRRELSGFSKQ